MEAVVESRTASSSKKSPPVRSQRSDAISRPRLAQLLTVLITVAFVACPIQVDLRKPQKSKDLLFRGVAQRILNLSFRDSRVAASHAAALRWLDEFERPGGCRNG